jgi:hypothetical protein
MCDNLIFYNICERKDENVKEIIHNVLEKQFGLEKAKENIKIDRAHRLGKRVPSKPRAIICKFNYYPDKEQILENTRKLKGSSIAVSELISQRDCKGQKKIISYFKKGEARRQKG